MKAINRILAALMSAIMLASASAVFAQEQTEDTTSKPATETSEAVDEEVKEEAKEAAKEEEFDLPERVEIIFKVGDDVLLINGESVKTETAPYVVGEGTTLVPVRVITEAFGAKVGWDGDTRTVTLNYPDVNIILQIGNPVAEVNGEAVTLLAAPELPDGRTMVPLRFISENFGAVVGYDEVTRGITVVKEAASEGETVEGVVDTEYIGDSFYGWTMKNPKNLTMEERSFDGKATEFCDEDNNYVSVFIEKKEADYDFEKEFKSEKEFYSKIATLVKAEKNVEDPSVSTMVIQARTSEKFYHTAYYVTEKYIFEVDVGVKNDEAKKKEFLEIGESFVLKYEETDTHDLSNLENGMRKFESEDMNFSILLPANLTGGESRLKVNEFLFASDDSEQTSVSIEIVSKSEAAYAAVGYVELDMENSSRGENKAITKTGDLEKRSYGELEVYEYTLTVSGSKTSDRLVKNLAFELGDYVYKMNIIIDARSESSPEETMNAILASMSFKEIDSEKVGIIMDSVEKDEDKSDKEIKLGKHSVTVPYIYKEAVEGKGIIIDNTGRPIVITVLSQAMPAFYTVNGVASELKTTLESSAAKNEDVKVTISDVKTVNINQKRFQKIHIVNEGPDSTLYSDLYMCEKDGMLYAFEVSVHELYYSDETIDEIEGIIATLK